VVSSRQRLRPIDGDRGGGIAIAIGVQLRQI
jgi:hypothetical protein